MQHSSTATRPKINALQALRAYAALSVMLGHGILEFHATKGTAMPFNEFPLVAGVDIFFVLSGFVMFHTSTGLWGDKRAPLRFWRRRFIRLVPLYWLFTSLMVATLLLLSRHVRSTEFDLWNVLSSYLFIPSERPGGRIAPVLSLGWTLNYEIFFYCLFGLCLRFDRRRGLSLLIGGVTGIGGYGLGAFGPGLLGFDGVGATGADGEDVVVLARGARGGARPRARSSLHHGNHPARPNV